VSARRLAFAGVLAFLVVVFWATRIVPGDRIVLKNADLYGYYYPAYAATFARLASGELPRWNPYQLCGEPWLATLQTAVFYPPHLVYLLLPTHSAMAVSAAAHLVLFALGTAAFARRIGLGVVPAALAALLFACRGHVTDLVYWPPSFEAAAWLPVGAIAAVDLARGGGWRAVGLLALATGASLLAGNPQMTVYTAYAWAVLCAAFLVAARPPARRWGTVALGFAVALAVGVLVAGVHLAPGMELGSQGSRGARTLTVAQMFPMGGAVLANPTVAFLRNAAFGRSPLALGVVGAALVAPALAWGAPRALAWGAFVLGLAALGYALGPVTPAFDVLRRLPGLGWFRVPPYALFVVDFGFAILAAIGLDAVARTTRRGPAVVATACAAMLAILAARGAIATNAPAWLAWAAVATLGAAAVAPDRARSAAIPALVVLAALDVVLAPTRGLAFPYGADVARRVAGSAPLYEEIGKLVGPDRFWLFTTEMPAVEIGPKIPTLYRVRSFDDYEPLVTRRQSEYFTYLWEGSATSARATYTFDGYLNTLTAPHGRPAPATRRRLLDLAAVKLVLFPTPTLKRTDIEPFVERIPLVSRGRLFDVPALTNPWSLPRAYVTYRTAPAPDVDALLDAMSRPNFDPLVSSYVEGDAPFVADPSAPPRGDAATITIDDTTVVELEATLAAPGLVVLADTFYPGWRATVDGAPAPIVATNHLFRGVAAPAGRHRVRFEYRPASLPIGVVASLAGTVVLVVLLRRGATPS